MSTKNNLRFTVVTLGIAVLAGCASVASTPARADPKIVTAETVNPVPASKTVIANDIAWNCNATRCTGRIDSQTVSVRQCKKLVREIGPVSAYRNGAGELGEADLTSCNASARP